MPMALRAHPRRCGADDFRVVVKPVIDGSSPQVRGRYLRVRAYRRCDGLIPAGAGQILCLVFGGVRGGAHPRRCGADDATVSEAVECLGSSPQVRGR